MSETAVLSSKRFGLDDALGAQEFFHSRGLTDGLPIVPPTPDAVRACLDWALLPPDHLVGIEPVRHRAVLNINDTTGFQWGKVTANR